MKFKKIIIVALFLLCFLMTSVVSAASDANDSTTSSSSDTIIPHTEDNSGSIGEQIDFDVNDEDEEIEKTKTKNTSNSLKETNTDSKKTKTKNENVLKDTQPVKVSDWSELNTSIQNIPDGYSSAFVLIGSQKEYIVNSAIIINNSKTIIIDGNNKTLNAQNKNRIFTVDNANLIIKNLNLINGKGENEEIKNIIYNLGGAIYAHDNSNITLINCKFTTNTAERGGAIYNNKGTVTITNSTFNSNNVDNHGGAIYNNKGTVTITNSNLTNNNATLNGGAIDNNEGTVTITNSNLTNNNAKRGGAIYNLDKLTITNSNLTNNNANEGEAINTYFSEVTINNGLFKNKNDIHWSLIYAGHSTLKIINTTFTNISSQYATAIYAEGCESYINNSRFINLFANKTGGALGFKNYNNVKIENCEFINVSSNKNGGVIFTDINGMRGFYAHGTISINNTLFSNCSSGFGGVCLQLGGKLSISYSNFTDNYADFNGGAIYTSMVESHIENCIFNNNHLGIYDGYPTYGGAIFCDYGELYLYDSEFINNSAYQGSGVYGYDSYYELLNLTFTNNTNPAIYSFFDKEGSIKENIYGITLNLTDFNNTYYPSVVCGEGMKIVLVNNTVNITDIPGRYDLRELNLTSPVNNQGDMGACWVFGMTSALESATLKALNITSDFSENNMQNTMIIYSQYGPKNPLILEGATPPKSMAYLLSWFGAFPQDYDTYDELGKISPLIRTDEDIHIQDIILLYNTPLTETDNNINILNNVKEAILRYGALGGSLYLNEYYYNTTTYAEYYPDLEPGNHVICVVGWDDNYPASNFLNNCPGDGAWIVKNSYGTEWGDEGYFYVSYYDPTLSVYPDLIYCFAAISLENTIQYNKNYQYDLSGLDSFDVDYKKYLNKFESVEDDVIAAVGTYFNKEGVDYTVEIIVNDISVYNQTGVSPYFGYHTIKLDKYISIKKGDIFSIAITSNAVPICSDTRVHFEKGTSFVYDPYSDKWTDLSKDNSVVCIKTYTLPQLIKTENLKIINDDELFIVDVNETNANVIVSINNNILSGSTDENGITKFKLPYLKNGKYTITTIYNQTSIINTIEVDIDLYKIIKEQNQTINTVNETINELNNLTQTQNNTINTLNETIKEQSQKLNKTREDLKNTQTQLKILNNEINKLKKQIETLKQEKTIPKTTTQIIAKPKTYKTKTKVKKYTITLKSSNKIIKKAKITLKIKGKTYKATTNSKGKATFKIKKLTRKGKYTATITYKGNKKYKKSTKKVKITIK